MSRKAKNLLCGLLALTALLTAGCLDDIVVDIIIPGGGYGSPIIEVYEYPDPYYYDDYDFFFGF